MKVRHYPGLPAPAPLQRWAAALLCGALLAVAGCGGSKPQAHRTAPPAQRDWPVVQADDPAAATSVLMRAIGLVGTPYRYGGNTPESGFDCSGLVGYVFKKLDYPLAPMVLAIVLGDRMEDAFRQSMLGSNGNIGVFWHNGLSGTIITLALILLFWPVIGAVLAKLKGQKKKSVPAVDMA